MNLINFYRTRHLKMSLWIGSVVKVWFVVPVRSLLLGGGCVGVVLLGPGDA